MERTFRAEENMCSPSSSGRLVKTLQKVGRGVCSQRKVCVTIMLSQVKMAFLILSLTVSIVLRGRVAAEPLLVRGEEDGGVLVADEALQRWIAALAVLSEGVLQAR